MARDTKGRAARRATKPQPTVPARPSAARGAKGKTNTKTKAKAKAGTTTVVNRKSAPTRPVLTKTAALAGTGYWLVKSEPESFSFDDLCRAPGRRTGWGGVRNYQARNFLRDTMRVGDLVLVYHSNAEPSGVAGVARVSGPARPDPTQFDPADDHFDADSDRADPTWFEVEIEAVARLETFVSLDDLKREPRLERMLVVQRGQRLSIQPVQVGEWRVVLALGGLDPDEFQLPARA